MQHDTVRDTIIDIYDTHTSVTDRHIEKHENKNKPKNLYALQVAKAQVFTELQEVHARDFTNLSSLPKNTDHHDKESRKVLS